MPEIVVRDLAELETEIQASPALLAYFTGPSCNVCKVIKPKILELLEKKFPEITFHSVDCDALPQAASHYGVLSIPTVVLYFDSRETARLVRTFSIGELDHVIERPYALLFGK
ncbi:MAG: thioredoxin family protein [Acidiferrobacterales bacterium]|jgi:thioredoxin 1|nr:thioredoxin family protein [Acidiferrobacterales bacterium]